MQIYDELIVPSSESILLYFTSGVARLLDRLRSTALDLTIFHPGLD